MKKFWTGSRLLALLVLTAFMAAGCGSKGVQEYKLDPKNPTAITIWHYYNGAQQTAFDQAVAEFNDTVGYEKGIVVEAYSQGNINELTQKVIASANKEVSAEELPDVFAAYADTAYTLDQLGLAASLDPYLSKEDLAAYVDGYIDEGRIDGEEQLKIFPVAKSTEVLMVNKTDWDKFAQATGASYDDLATIEGLTKTAEAYYQWTDSLTEAPDDGKAFFGRDALANYMIIGNRQLGNEIFEVHNGKATINVDKAIYKRLWENYYVPMVQGYFAAHGRFRADDASAGDIIALVGSTTGATYFPQQVVLNDNETYPVEAVTLPAPIFEGGERYAVQQGAGMMVVKSTPEKEYAATVFLKWFTDDERNIDFSVRSGYLPVKKSANDWEKIEPVFEEQGSSAANTMLEDTVHVAIEEVSQSKMYTNKPFDKGTWARSVLEHNMSDQIDRDLALIESRMSDGMSRQEAVEPFISEVHFEECFAEFSQALSTPPDSGAQAAE